MSLVGLDVEPMSKCRGSEASVVASGFAGGGLSEALHAGASVEVRDAGEPDAGEISCT